jgi:6-phosphogluconolactonase (cycloisomerase 2 family)
MRMFPLRLLLVATLICSTLWAQERRQGTAGGSKAPLMAYVGTFSSPLHGTLPTQVDLPPGNGRGIHIFEVDRETGAMTPRGVVESGVSPNCLTFNKEGTRLYVTNETDKFEGTDSGSISAYEVNRKDGSLSLLNTVSSGGHGPTYLSLHPNGKFLLVANYFAGSVAVLPVVAGGKLGAPVDVKKGVGKVGPARAANAPPGSFAFSGHDVAHAHMIQTDPAGRYVISTDLGLDQILVWKFDAEKGLLAPNEPAAVALPPGDGPRHFAFHPNGRWFYSLQEEGSTIVLFDYDNAKGQLSSRQTISSLPPGYAGSNFCSEILVSGDGRFVYAGNRLHDGIAIFAVAEDGSLRFVGEEWSRGDYPRSFSFDPSGNFFFCCNQRADNVTVFRGDKDSGLLKFTGHYAPVGNPSAIAFLDLHESP